MRVFIVSNDPSFRFALLLLVESEPGMVVIGTSTQSERLLSVVEALQPEVLLLDLESVMQVTPELISDLHHSKWRPKVIVLSNDPQGNEMVLAAGADDFIPKDSPPDKLLPALRRMRLSQTGE